MNSDYKRVARKILAEQTKSDHKNTMIWKVQQIAQEIRLKIKKYGEHEQIQMDKVGGRKNRKVNCRKKKAKWERKKYLQECDSVIIVV